MTRADVAASGLAGVLAVEDEPTALAALAMACAEALSNMSLPANLTRDEAVQVFFAQVCNIMVDKERENGRATTQARAPDLGDRD